MDLKTPLMRRSPSQEMIIPETLPSEGGVAVEEVVDAVLEADRHWDLWDGQCAS